MATVQITLNKNNPPYYVDKFGAPASYSDNIKWVAEDGEFSITIRDASTFFTAAEAVEKFILDSAGVAGPTSKQITILDNLKTYTEQWYEVFCISLKDAADAPPRIIIVPHT